MTRRAHILVLAALTACSGHSDRTSGADQADDPALIAPAFARADRNGDEVVSADEWAADSAALFDQLDRDRNGALDAVELRESFEVLDADGDGVIEREEAGELVERGDLDDDGRLSPAELGQVDWARLSADGQIDRNEFYGSRDQLFLAADSNRDGRLSHREIDPVRFPAFRF